MRLIRGDCLEVLKELPDGSIDLVLTDPPYGTTACAWDSVIPLEPMWEQLKRLVKDRSAIVLFSSQPFTSLLTVSNLSMFRCEWIWKKSNGGGFLNANRYPLKRHENIVVFARNQPVYNPQYQHGRPYSCRSSAAGETTQDQTVAGWVTNSDGLRYPISVQEFPNETGLHPTQKPVALMAYLIKTYSNPGDTVLDFTMGSGTTGVACAYHDRDFIGIELNEEYFDMARKRIDEARGVGSLFPPDEDTFSEQKDLR